MQSLLIRSIHLIGEVCWFSTLDYYELDQNKNKQLHVREKRQAKQILVVHSRSHLFSSFLQYL
jgi:hypothetical protein